MWELGFIFVDTSTYTFQIGHPLYYVQYQNQLPVYLKYSAKYILHRFHNSYSLKCYFTLYDGWREHSGPQEARTFLDSL